MPEISGNSAESPPGQVREEALGDFMRADKGERKWNTRSVIPVHARKERFLETGIMGHDRAEMQTRGGGNFKSVFIKPAPYLAKGMRVQKVFCGDSRDCAYSSGKNGPLRKLEQV